MADGTVFDTLVQDGKIKNNSRCHNPVLHTCHLYCTCWEEFTRDFQMFDLIESLDCFENTEIDKNVSLCQIRVGFLCWILVLIFPEARFT